TSSGSNFRVPPVNFYRAVQGQSSATVAAAVALTFMGVRLEKWPKNRQEELATFFSRIAFKKTAEWKEEIVTFDPAPHGPLEVVFPDGSKAIIPPEQDPRKVFADWFIRADNPWFARNIVNRIWSWLLGRGVIHEPDDIRSDNPPVYPELLTYLEKQLVQSNFDLRHIYRLILNSGVYQQSSIPNSDTTEAETAFACYPVRRLDAEVLIDALCWITGTHESYSSPIPEPFTFVPEQNRTIELADGSITSPFLEMFGRPARDTGLESERSNQPSDAQRLHLLNSTHIQKKIQNSNKLNRLLRSARWRRPVIIDEIYLNVLSRLPLPEEREIAAEYFQTEDLKVRQAAVDLVWSLINTKEFLYRH
ncbi:MAG: DUF1553 domain-containing protein, partial [Sedimentisphaerales bacterium]|nr:DUF1553 domain-containing protein [Sedimentisphaerales bacterium]